MPYKNPSTATFDDVLDALLDKENLFPPTYLHRFSDLNPKEIAEFKKVFPQVEVTRRRALLEDLEELADADTLVLVEEIGRACLTDEDAQVRALAIRLLWDVEDKRLVPILMRMMHQDPDPTVRATAANALGIFVYQGELEKSPVSLLTILEDHLLEVTRGSDDTQVRRRALESLGYSSRPEVPDLLRAAYNHNDTEWLESALFAMGRSADSIWQNEVIRQFDHPKVSVQLEAVQAAGELALETAREQLLNMVNENEVEDDDVRAAVIRSLSQIGGEGVRGALEHLLESTDDDDETAIIEEALENLDLTEEMSGFDLIDVDFDEKDLHVIEPGDLDTGLETKKKPGRKRH
jgi:HEAT repeat protein